MWLYQHICIDLVIPYTSKGYWRWCITFPIFQYLQYGLPWLTRRLANYNDTQNFQPVLILGKFYQTSVHSHQVVQQWREWFFGVLCVCFGPMRSPTVWFDGLYFRPFVRRNISTFNFSANFVVHFIFLSDTDILRCHRHICVVFILQFCPVMKNSSV
jgi:hypothetical protein